LRPLLEVLASEECGGTFLTRRGLQHVREGADATRTFKGACGSGRFAARPSASGVVQAAAVFARSESARELCSENLPRAKLASPARATRQTVVVADTEIPLISIDPAVCHGQPCVAGTRVMVSVVLDALGAGMTVDEVLIEYPTLTREGVLAAMRHGAELARREGDAVASE
jgi:uncharacterized protein (DUF433 family)